MSCNCMVCRDLRLEEEEGTYCPLMEEGIDPYACEYLSVGGCKLKERKPSQCKAYKCDNSSEWEEISYGSN